MTSTKEFTDAQPDGHLFDVLSPEWDLAEDLEDAIITPVITPEWDIAADLEDAIITEDVRMHTRKRRAPLQMTKAMCIFPEPKIEVLPRKKRNWKVTKWI